MITSKIYLIAFSVIILIYFFLRVSGLTLQPVFCDEAIYIHWAQIIQRNLLRNAFIPLSDGETPLFMWLAAPFQYYVSDPLIAGRLISILSGFSTLIGLAVLGSKFFNRRVGLISAFLISIVPFTVFFDKLALVDSMLATFSLWSLIISLSLVQKFDIKKVILLGFTLGGGILVKTPGIFSFLTLPVALLAINPKQKKIKNILQSVISIACSALIGYGIFNLLRFSHFFTDLFSKKQDFYFPLTRLIQTPFDPFIPHLKNLWDWLPKMLTWPIIMLIAISIVLILNKKNMISLAIFLWGILPLVVMMTILKIFTARYILFCIIPLIFLAGWALDILIDIFPIKRRFISLFIAIIILLIPAFSFDFFLSTNPQKAPLPVEERRIYFEDWTAGYGLKEIAKFLTKESIEQKILVVTEGFFGTLPDGLQIYLKENPKIEVWYSTSTLDAEVYAKAKIKSTYFIVNKSHNTFNTNLRLLHEYPKAKTQDLSQDALLLYQVLPYENFTKVL